MWTQASLLSGPPRSFKVLNHHAALSISIDRLFKLNHNQFVTARLETAVVEAAEVNSVVIIMNGQCLAKFCNGYQFCALSHLESRSGCL